MALREIYSHRNLANFGATERDANRSLVVFEARSSEKDRE